MDNGIGYLLVQEAPGKKGIIRAALSDGLSNFRTFQLDLHWQLVIWTQGSRPGYRGCKYGVLFKAMESNKITKWNREEKGAQ